MLRSGSVQIALFGGATVDLRGPCQVELKSDQQVFLRQGDILVSVHDDDAKLVINTPVGELLHLGTEFGVSVAESGETEMFVFAGSVEVKQGLKGLPAGSATSFKSRRPAPCQLDGLKISAAAQFEAFRQNHPALTSDSVFKPRPLSIDGPGYRVRYMKVDSLSLDGLSVADSVLNGQIATVKDTTVEGIPFIDFQDHPEGDGKEIPECLLTGGAVSGRR